MDCFDFITSKQYGSELATDIRYLRGKPVKNHLIQKTFIVENPRLSVSQSSFDWGIRMKKMKILLLFTIIFSSILLLNGKSLVKTTDRTIRLASDDNGRDAAWYYDNLNSLDRRKIRQAMDYAIPREMIIDGILRGYALNTATSLSPYMLGFDPSLQARNHDPNYALDLLEEVFGYRYNEGATDGSEVPYFSLTFAVPTPNTARSRWASLIALEFQRIGIDVEMKWWNWNIFRPRIFDEPVGEGFDYDHGGYDAYFVGVGPDIIGGLNTWAKGIDFSYDFTSYSSPSDGNTAWINNAEVDDIWDRAINSSDLTDRLQALEDFQWWYNYEAPRTIISQQLDLYAVDPDLTGFDPYLGYNFQNWTLDTQDTLFYVQERHFQNFNPLLSINYAELPLIENIHGSLTKIRSGDNITHPVGFLADSWNHSPDYLEWTVNLREGVLWHDGTPVTADDVVFTYQAVFNEETGIDAKLRDILISVFGEASNIIKVDTYKVRFILPSFHPYVESLGFGLPILQKAQMLAIPFSDWRTDDTNNGIVQLIGCGPYYFDNFDGFDTITLKRANTYNGTLMGHDPNAVGGGIWWSNATIETAQIRFGENPNSAILGLENQSYDVLDSRMGLQPLAKEVNSSWGKLITTPRWGYQELTYNQYSPIWGMNPRDPRTMYPDPIPEPDRNLEWYYDNLTPEDRKKIRQAMDYVIPRDQVIDELYHGYAVKTATVINQQLTGVYDPSIQARNYDIEQAKNLMEEVFGKRYINYNGAESDEFHTAEPYFSMTLAVPNTQSDRSQWAALVARSFQDIGIDVTLTWWGWNIGSPRIFDEPVGTGFDYTHGGFDAFFVGFNFNPEAEGLVEIFSPTSFVPNGWNYYWIENEEVAAILESTMTSYGLEERIQALREFQAWFYGEVPASIIRQRMQLFAMDPDLHGFDPFLGLYNIQNWTMSTQTSISIAQPGDFFNFNPLISNSYYDSMILKNIFCSLSRRRGAYNLTHAVPWLANSWSHSPDYLIWDVTLNSGVKWSDGTEVTADDVVFTYHAALNPAVGHLSYDIYSSILGGTSAIEKTGTYNIRFTLPAFYPFVETVLFGVEILQKAQMETLPFVEWKTHATNTNYPPIGCGAYMFDSFPNPSTFIIKPNPHYNGTFLGHDPTMIGGPNWLPDPHFTSVTFNVVKEVSSAISGLQTGVYDFIDAQMRIQPPAAEIIESDWGKLVFYPEWGYQELGYNQYSPIWGMNPHDPRLMYEEPHITTPEIEPTSEYEESSETTTSEESSSKTKTSEKETTEPVIPSISGISGYKAPLIILVLVSSGLLRRKFNKKS